MPDEVPFMLLPGAVLFPNGILPLNIFESKYRRMLADTLEGGRMFGVAMVRPGITEVRAEDDVHRVAGVGLVRACVGNPDGTSCLVLHGLGRFRVTAWDRSRPYWVGRIQPVESETTGDTRDLEVEILRLCAAYGRVGEDILPSLADYTPGESDPSLLADLVAASLAADGAVRQSLLEETNVNRRLERLIELLR